MGTHRCCTCFFNRPCYKTHAQPSQILQKLQHQIHFSRKRTQQNTQTFFFDEHYTKKVANQTFLDVCVNSKCILGCRSLTIFCWPCESSASSNSVSPSSSCSSTPSAASSSSSSTPSTPSAALSSSSCSSSLSL